MKWKRLIEVRKSYGYKQSDVAKKLGISMGSYSRWENLEYQPNLKQLKRLSEIFAVSIDWLLYNDPFASASPSHTRNVMKVALQAREWELSTLFGYPDDCEPKTLAGLIAYTIKKLDIDDYISAEEVERLFKGTPANDPFQEDSK